MKGFLVMSKDEKPKLKQELSLTDYQTGREITISSTTGTDMSSKGITGNSYSVKHKLIQLGMLEGEEFNAFLETIKGRAKDIATKNKEQILKERKLTIVYAGNMQMGDLLELVLNDLPISDVAKARIVEKNKGISLSPYSSR
jgi:hypothetical protein